MAKRVRWGKGTVQRVRWADRQLLWLEQVGRDPAVTDFGLRVAVMIAAQTDPATGAACVSQRELAGSCRATKGGVRKVLRALVERGHLTTPVPGTRRRAATYTPDVHALRALAAPRLRGQRTAVVDGCTRVYLSGRAATTDGAMPVHLSAPDGVTGGAPSRSDGHTAITPSRQRRRKEPAQQRAARLEAEARERRQQS